MGRRTRPNLPGAFFHVTARLQGRAPLFTPSLRRSVIECVREEAAKSDIRLVAFCVMLNHVHLVVRQGREQLHRFMQPLLRRIAARVQRTHSMEGHVFERRFRESHCGDAQYLRNAIAYTHLNPVRAGLCSHWTDYEWSSDSAYMGRRASADVDCDLALPLFATSFERTPAELRQDYTSFLRWRLHRDAVFAATEAGIVAAISNHVREPETFAGDWHFRERCCRIDLAEVGQPRPDLRDVARSVLADAGVDPGMLSIVRSRYGGATIVELRHGIIARAALQHFKGIEIARFLNLSPGAVSRALRKLALSQRCG